MQDSSINLVHYLPGRLRIRFSMPPRNIERIKSEILGHKGVNFVKFTPITRSILVYYNSTEIDTAEIIVRIGISLSVDYGMKSINILGNKPSIGFTKLDNYTLLAVAVSCIAKLLKVNRATLDLLSYNAGFSTMIAVI